MSQENGTFTPEEVEAVRAQLAAELQTRDQALAERDKAITGLQASSQELRAQLDTARKEFATITAAAEAATVQAHESARADLAAFRTDLKAATGKYRSLLIASNPAIPVELLQGDDIGALDASMEKARAIVEKIKVDIQAQNSHTPIPPGAPPRSAPDIESLSATDKIKFALKGK